MSTTLSRLRRGRSPSLAALQPAIDRFVGEHGRDRSPLAWTADAEAIVEKVRPEYHALASMARPAG